MPITRMISRYFKSITNSEAIAPKVDRLYVYDNSEEGETARPLFRLTDGVLGKITSAPEWSTFYQTHMRLKIQGCQTKTVDITTNRRRDLRVVL